MHESAQRRARRPQSWICLWWCGCRGGDGGRMDTYFLAMAQSAGGVFAHADAARWGMSDNDLSRLVRTGRLTRPHHGAYALPRQSETPERDHAHRVSAVLRARPGARAAARSALAVAQLPLVQSDLATLVLCGPGAERYRRGSVVTYPMPPGEPEAVIDGAPTVSLETAIFQTVARDSVMTAVVAADAALHRGLVTVGSLEQRRVELRRLAPRGRLVLALVDAKSESPGESVLRVILVGLGHRVQTQVVIATPDGEFVARVDGLVDGWIVTEFDGASKYAGANGHDELIREKRREDRLRALGYAVIRITWADLFVPGRIEAMVRAVYAQRRGGGTPAPRGSVA